MVKLLAIALLLSAYSSTARGAVSEPNCTSYGYTITCYYIQPDSYAYLYSYFEGWHPSTTAGSTTARPTTTTTEGTGETGSGLTETGWTETGWTETGWTETESVPTISDWTEPPSDTVTLEIRDSILTDLPGDSFYFIFSDVNRLIFTNCSFKLFPFNAMAQFNYVSEVQVYDSYIASWSPSYMRNANFIYHLTTMTISSSMLADLPYQAFYELPYLETINFSGNKVVSIQNDAFYSLGILRTLDLSNNSIQFIAPQAFYDVFYLQTMYLHDNNLMSLSNETSFQSQMPNIETLTLGGNPFICDCNLEWLKNWIDQNKINASNPTCVCPQSASFEDVDFCGWSAKHPTGRIAGCGTGCNSGPAAAAAPIVRHL